MPELRNVMPNLSMTLEPGAFEGDDAQVEMLTRIVGLLQDGDRDRARQFLAEYLRRIPDDPGAWELSGIILMEEGRFDVARQALQRSVALHPRRVSALSKLAVVLLQEGEIERAETGLRETLALDPNDTLSLAYLAWLEESRGRYPEAISLYERLLFGERWTAEGLTQLHLPLAGLYLRTGAYRQALDLLEPGLDDNTLRALPAAGLIQGIALIEMRRVSDAKAVLERVEQVLPDDEPTLQLARGVLIWAEGDDDAAIAALQRVATQHPQLAMQADYQRARIEAARGNGDAAMQVMFDVARTAGPDAVPGIAHSLTELLLENDQRTHAQQSITRFLEQHPDHARLHYWAAESLRRMGDNNGALAAADRVIELQPAFQAPYHLAGLIARQSGNPEMAERYYRRALERDSNSLEAWISLAALNVERGSIDQALAALREGLEHTGQHPALLFEEASVLEALGETASANTNYRRILEQQPTHYPSLNNLALNLIALGGGSREALELATRAYELAGEEVQVQATYGWALLNAGQAQQALPLLESAVERAPDDGTMHHYLASAYEALGREDEARQHFLRASELN